MGRTTILGLAMLSACSCDGPARSDRKPREALELRAVDKPGDARQPVTAESCNAACNAAASQGCEKLAARCNYEATGWIHVGPHTLRCRAACAASCLGAATGVPMCVEQCAAEGTVPADAEPSASDPGKRGL